MFTPPPSPLPQAKSQLEAPSQPSLAPAPSSKREIATRTKWTVLFVPFVLIFIALSTRYISHPAFFDVAAGLSEEQLSSGTALNWGIHKRHPQQGESSVAFPSSVPSNLGATSTASGGQAGPTSVPSIPTTPTLPLPFPQPFDTTLSTNFSTQSCVNFYTNMTESAPFRQCRPFGLLIDTSSAFIEAQDNITLLNDLVWGTCNTDVAFSQCTSNMEWFAQQLDTECATELSNNNVFVADTRTGLLVYSLMRNVGCQSNPSTNTYCYVSAVAETTPFDLYYYQLPFGISLPNTTNPSCSPCTQTIMGLYNAAVEGSDPNTTDEKVKDQLRETYGPAAQLSDNICGQGFVAASASASNANGAIPLSVGRWNIYIAAMVVLLSMLF